MSQEIFHRTPTNPDCDVAPAGFSNPVVQGGW